MSINMLANAAAARRADIGPNTTPSNISEIAAAAITPPENAPTQQQTASGTTTALNVLFGYIPTEVVTLYVAVSAALQPDKTTGNAAISPSLTSLWVAFWCFFVAAPLAVWVIYASKIRSVGKSLPINYGSWPLWEMTAALVAFFAWGFVLPNSPFSYRYPEWYSPALASIAVLLASSLHRPQATRRLRNFRIL
jgi:hypothetical protein